MIGMLVLALSGCASAVPTEPGDASAITGAMSEAQRSALADHVVSYDEYQDAYRRYSACVEAAGYAVERLGETNRVIDYRIPEAAVQDGSASVCYDRHFRLVDSTWQLSREDSSEQAAQYRDCLTAAGITPAGTLHEMYDQLVGAGIDPLQCIDG